MKSALQQLAIFPVVVQVRLPPAGITDLGHNLFAVCR